jgi:environmental stress-induced protein Ves
MDPFVGQIRRRIRRSDWRTMPWKNGGGITHELWREGEGKEGWSFRISLAEVREAGPFSRFEGIDRVILLMEGAGFVIRRADGVRVKITQVAQPFSFMGEDSWDCELVDGPVMDFNVMTARPRCAAVWFQPAGMVLADWFLSMEDGKINGEPIEKMELIACDGCIFTSVGGIAIRVSPERSPS